MGFCLPMNCPREIGLCIRILKHCPPLWPRAGSTDLSSLDQLEEGGLARMQQLAKKAAELIQIQASLAQVCAYDYPLPRVSMVIYIITCNYTAVVCECAR